LGTTLGRELSTIAQLPERGLETTLLALKISKTVNNVEVELLKTNSGSSRSLIASAVASRGGRLRTGLAIALVLLLVVVALRLFRAFGPVGRMESLAEVGDVLVIDTHMHIFPGFTERGLYVVDVDSGRLIRWVDIDLSASSPVLFPRRKQLLFGVRSENSMMAFTISRDGRIEEAEDIRLFSDKLETSTFVQAHAISPDGSRIAFINPVGLSGPLNIYIQRIDGTGVRLVAQGGEYASPSWSPDGSTLAFMSYEGVIVSIPSGLQEAQR
jgi:dipeptidyl aminopeptidase/acylaminoacyl peptidase